MIAGYPGTPCTQKTGSRVPSVSLLKKSNDRADLISTDTAISDKEIIRIYSERRNIEVLFKAPYSENSITFEAPLTRNTAMDKYGQKTCKIPEIPLTFTRFAITNGQQQFPA